jgi:hypothetical protein
MMTLWSSADCENGENANERMIVGVERRKGPRPAPAGGPCDDWLIA